MEATRLGFVSRIDPILECATEFRNDAHLTAAVHEKEGLAVRNKNPKRPSLQHRRKIACPVAGSWKR